MSSLGLPKRNKIYFFQYCQFIQVNQLKDFNYVYACHYILIMKYTFPLIFRVDSCWIFCLLSVLPEYGGQGVGELITKRSMQVAKDLGVPMSRASFASTFSQKIGLKCGFEPVIEAGYQEHYKHFDKMSAEVKTLHTKCVAMTKVLYSLK